MCLQVQKVQWNKASGRCIYHVNNANLPIVNLPIVTNCISL